MQENGGRDPGNPAQRDRLSRLSEASRRINESLDFDTVLQRILDSARSLTGASYGVITLVDGEGRLLDLLASGMSSEESRQLWDLPGQDLFSYLTGLPEPLRLPDLLGHVRSLDLPEFRPPLPVGPLVPFLSAPICHRGLQEGNIYLAKDTSGPEFSQEDEDTLVMFASQAALVIDNVRRYRDERKARTDLETLINISPVGVAVLDAKTGSVLSENREARRIMDGLRDPDQTHEEFMGSLTARRTDGVEVSHSSLTQALRAGETVRAEEVRLEVPDGRSVTILVNATPIRYEDGELESFVATIQDLTPVEEMVRLRAEFLGMVSHELRTPLTSIRGSAHTLIDEEASLGPAEMRQFHRIIIEQSEHMRGLINNLLDLAHIETGTLSVYPEPSDVASLVDEARSAFLRAGGRHSLDVHLQGDLPLVTADRRRVAQVLGNLLSNAARYSGDSSPIELSVGRQGLHVAFSVSDQGRGISTEELPRLFRKYARLDGESRGGNLAGSGLGLAICKGIVETHGGRIWAESEGPDLGARFTFTLPVVEESGSGGATGAPPRRRAGRRTRVLAVDDDPLALRYIRDALTRAGYHPVVTADPGDVPRLMEEEHPQLVLLDLVLPEGDGIELMQRILATTDVPVIFVSAYGQEENVTRALDMGAVDYVVKPFAPSELAARVRTALRQRAGLSPAAQPRPYLLGDLGIDYAQRRVTVAGDPVELTATEYAVLYELSANAGNPLTHDQLVARVWGVGRSGDSGLVRTIVRRLRQKLGDDAENPRYIFTEPRVGYRMARGEEPEREE